MIYWDDLTTTMLATTTAPRQSAMFESLLWFGALILAVMGGLVGVLLVRRRLRDKGDVRLGLGLTLEDLRRARDEGRLTILEYEALKEVVIREAKSTSPDKVLKQGSRT